MGWGLLFPTEVAVDLLYSLLSVGECRVSPTQAVRWWPWQGLAVSEHLLGLRLAPRSWEEAQLQQSK